MKDALLDFITIYRDYVGNSKIILLFLVSVIVIYYFNHEDNTKRRRINPTVFLLSVWSGIAYAFTLTIKKPFKKALVMILLLITIVGLSGGFIISEEAIKESIYYYNPMKITIISVIVIISFFILYYLISLELFEEISNRLIFMGFSVLLHLFAFYTVKSLRVSVFLYPLSIGSVILHDIMPFSLWALLTRLRISEEKEAFDNKSANVNNDALVNTEDENYEEEWDLKKHKVLNMRNMAIAFAVLLVIFIASVFVLNSKINNLYNVTVALEKATEDKVSLFEFKQKGREEVDATLLVTGEGTSTVTGGCNKDAGKELYDFITSHVTRVNKWYIEANDKDALEGLQYCIANGLSVDEVYYYTGVEKIGTDN